MLRELLPSRKADSANNALEEGIAADLDLGTVLVQDQRSTGSFLRLVFIAVTDGACAVWKDLKHTRKRLPRL